MNSSLGDSESLVQKHPPQPPPRCSCQPRPESFLRAQPSSYPKPPLPGLGPWLPLLPWIPLTLLEFQAPWTSNFTRSLSGHVLGAPTYRCPGRHREDPGWKLRPLQSATPAWGGERGRAHPGPGGAQGLGLRRQRRLGWLGGQSSPGTRALPSSGPGRAHGCRSGVPRTWRRCSAWCARSA